MKKQIIHIENAEISLLSQGTEDYISLTDMAHSQMQEHIIFRWLSLKSTIEYIGEWETLYNPNFNYTEFGTIKNAAGSNNFVLSVKTWIEKTNAIGIVAKAGLCHVLFAFSINNFIFAEDWTNGDVQCSFSKSHYYDSATIGIHIGCS